MTEQAGAVIGINLGNTYGSIASINPHGRADVIANEDGERQIATRISFAGEQVYIGNQATAQLVRNAANTIDAFVSLLGLSYSQLSEADKKRVSAAVIDVDGQPGFDVTINGKPTKLTAAQVAERFIASLYGSALDFLSGAKVAGVVLSYPPFFSATQIAALKTAAEATGLTVLQLIPAPSAALAAYHLTTPGPRGALPSHPDGDQHTVEYDPTQVLDRNVVVLDVGGTTTDVTVVAARAGLYAERAYVHDASGAGVALDDALMKYFAKEFTKKTKVTIAEDNKRAWAKLRNEVEGTKRALSASNSAQCSVESLAEGLDFSASINRMRLDMLASPVYQNAVRQVSIALEKAKLEPANVDEIVLAGGTAKLLGLQDALLALFPEDSHTKITASIDADQVIARGATLEAQYIAKLGALQTGGTTPKEHLHVTGLPTKNHVEIPELQANATTHAIGVLIPAPDSWAKSDNETIKASIFDGKVFVPIVKESTPLPARRAVRFLAPAGKSLLELSEGTFDYHTRVIEPEPLDEEDEDLEDVEPEKVRTAFYRPTKALAALAPTPIDGKVELTVIVHTDGAVTVSAGDEKVELAAP